ncbi:MAG: hypothetical protein IPP37_05605 [Saprospiraceae bacterium]|nr:hypothetical protein [Saprospiraceae bacterium]
MKILKVLLFALLTIFTSVSCSKEDMSPHLNHSPVATHSNTSLPNYNPCQSSKFRFDYDRSYFQKYMEHQTEIDAYLNTCDTLLYANKSMLFTINDIYRKTESPLDSNFFKPSDLFIDFQSDPRVSDNFRNIINQLLYIIDQSSSYEEYLQQLTALAATINLDTLSADDRIKISTLFFIVECESYDTFCTPEIRMWERPGQEGQTGKRLDVV